jgi:hypothetical protein
MIARALLERGHGRRIGVGKGDLCFAYGGGHSRDPLDRRLGELIQVLLAIESTLGYQVGGSIRGLSLINVGMDHLAKRLWITAMAIAQLHQHGNARWVLDDQLQHDLVKVLAMISTVALGDVHDWFRRWLVAVIAPIDMKARIVKVHIGWAQMQTFSGSRRDETIECCHPIVIEGIQSTTERIIVPLLGGHTGRDESVGGLNLEEPVDQGERLIDKPQAIEHHRVDRFTNHDVPLFRVLLGRLVNNVAHSKFTQVATS